MMYPVSDLFLEAEDAYKREQLMWARPAKRTARVRRERTGLFRVRPRRTAHRVRTV
jgi:hypothetical protein